MRKTSTQDDTLVILKSIQKNIVGLDQKIFGLDQKFEGKFNGLDKKFDKIDSKFDNIDRKFDSIDKKFELIDQKIEDTEKRLILRIETSNRETRQYLMKNVNTYIDLKIKQLSEDLDKKISKFVHLIQKTVDPLLKELETRQQDRQIHSQQHEEIDSRLKTVEIKVKGLQAA